MAVVKEEKDALADALERLRALGTGSSSGTRGLREAVRSLEEQLLRERAKSQRSASKRGQEQRHLMEQVSSRNHRVHASSEGHDFLRELFFFWCNSGKKYKILIRLNRTTN